MWQQLCLFCPKAGWTLLAWHRQQKAAGKFSSVQYIQGAWKWKESRTRFPGSGLKCFTTAIMIDALVFHTKLLLFPVVRLLTPLAESWRCRPSDSRLCQSLCAEPDGSELIGNHWGPASSASLPRPSVPTQVHFLQGKKKIGTDT